MLSPGPADPFHDEDLPVPHHQRAHGRWIHASLAAPVAHLQRGRARDEIPGGEVPGQVPGGRWAGGRAAVSRLLPTNVVYLCSELTHSHCHIEVRTFSSPAARTPRVEAGWMVLAPLPPKDQGKGVVGGWPSSLRVESRTRPVSCNGPRREGGQGYGSTGPALDHRLRCLAAEDRPSPACAPREPPDYFYPQLALHQPARLLDSPRATVSSFNPYSCGPVQVGSQTGRRQC